jgi:hypothetical protein
MGGHFHIKVHEELNNLLFYKLQYKNSYFFSDPNKLWNVFRVKLRFISYITLCKCLGDIGNKNTIFGKVRIQGGNKFHFWVVSKIDIVPPVRRCRLLKNSAINYLYPPAYFIPAIMSSNTINMLSAFHSLHFLICEYIHFMSKLSHVLC